MCQGVATYASSLGSFELEEPMDVYGSYSTCCLEAGGSHALSGSSAISLRSLFCKSLISNQATNDSVAPFRRFRKRARRKKRIFRWLLFCLSLRIINFPFDIMTVGCEYTGKKVLFLLSAEFPAPLATTIICLFHDKTEMEAASGFDVDMRTLYWTVSDILRDTVHYSIEYSKTMEFFILFFYF